jgi:DNA polymerase alpha subunit B
MIASGGFVPPSSSFLSPPPSQAIENGFSQTQGVAYEMRKNHGQSVASMNINLGKRGKFEASDIKPLGLRSQLTTNDTDFENVERRYRFMFTTLDERARALDRHLLNLQSEMCTMASVDESALQPVGVPSQDMVWVCGRICCDSAEGKINKASVLLEGSRKESNGRKVQLDLSELPGFSVFPGQIVLVEGINSSGRKMIAKRIIEGSPKPHPMTLPSKLLEYHHTSRYQGGQALHIVTAAGPFTTSENLEYQPLNDLLLKMLEIKPDILILMGPFVDITQPLLASGDVQLTNDDNNAEETHAASYEMVFMERIVSDCLNGLFNSQADHGILPTHIVLVPSLLDAHHEFIFPQPPFGDRDEVVTSFFDETLGVLHIPYSKESDPLKRVHLMSNPCMFR